MLGEGSLGIISLTPAAAAFCYRRLRRRRSKENHVSPCEASSSSRRLFCDRRPFSLVGENKTAVVSVIRRRRAWCRLQKVLLVAGRDARSSFWRRRRTATEEANTTRTRRRRNTTSRDGSARRRSSPRWFFSGGRNRPPTRNAWTKRARRRRRRARIREARKGTSGGTGGTCNSVW